MMAVLCTGRVPSPVRKIPVGGTACLSRALLAPVAFLGRGGTLTARCMSGVLGVSLLRSRLPLGGVFRFGFCGDVLLVSGVAHCRGSVGFVGALGGLLFLFFLFRVSVEPEGL